MPLFTVFFMLDLYKSAVLQGQAVMYNTDVWSVEFERATQE